MEEAQRLVIERLRTGRECIPKSNRQRREWACQAPVNDVMPKPGVEIRPELLSWNGGTVRRLAWSIRTSRSYADLPLLAAALVEAGCTDPWVLGHLREVEYHKARCWLLRQLTGEP